MGQCSTESFLLYKYLEEKDFLNYPKSPKSKQGLLKNTHITFIVLKYWFLSVFFGEWRIACYGGVGINPEQHLIMTLSQRQRQPWKN